MRSIRALAALSAGAAVIALGTAAHAQQWPTRSILVVSPFAAGTANDIVARIVLDQVGQQIGQAFVIENRPGAGGTVGVASVVRADPDGYTLLLSSSSMSSAVILHKSLPLRRAARSRADRDAWRAAERAGGGAVEGLQDGGRPCGGGQGKARHAQLRLGRHRLRLAYRRRALSPRRRD